MKKKQQLNYYSTQNIDELDADYNIIFGERSNGKTFQLLKKALMLYLKEGKRSAYLRRWKEDFKKKGCDGMFSGVLENVDLEKLSGGRWNGIKYYAGAWKLCNYDDGKKVAEDELPFMFGFSLTTMEHDKSTTYPNLKLIIFDEFISRSGYLPDEFTLFQNVLSTLIRANDDVKIYLLGNTVNFYCPYFKEMGLKHAKDMKIGTIDLYTIGEHGTKIAVEYCEGMKGGKPSDKYFCFDNPHAKMITSGDWELALYPHLPIKYRPKDVVFHFFVVFEEDILHCEIVTIDGKTFIYVHEKTTDLQKPDDDLIFSTEYDTRINWRRGWGLAQTPFETKIYNLVKQQQIYFQSNTIGEVFRNYVEWSKQAVFYQ